MAVRLPRLGAESLWYDETVSAFLSGEPVTRLIVHTSLDIHPPGYYLLLRMWRSVAGRSEFALAFLSAWFGVLLVPLSYGLGWRFFGRPRAAVLAAILSALSAYSVWYSQEVRMYTLAAALAMLLALAAERWLRRPDSARAALTYGVLAAASLYILYYLAFLVASLSLFLLLRAVLATERRRQYVWPWLLGHGLALALYLPWLPTAVRQALDPPVPPWRSFTPMGSMLRDGVLALVGSEALPTAAWPLAAALVLAAIAGCFLALDRRRAVLVSGALIAPWAAIVLLSLYRPLYHARYLFPFAPFLWAGLAAIGARLRSRAVIVAFVAVFAIVNAVGLAHAWRDPRYRPDDLRAALAGLAADWAPGDVILANAGYTYTAIAYYWPGEPPRAERLTADPTGWLDGGPLVLIGGSVGGEPSLGWGEPRADFYSLTASEAESAIARWMGKAHRLWQFRLYDTVTDPDGVLRRDLERRYLLTEDRAVPGPGFARVQAYVPRTEAMPCLEPVVWSERVATCAQVPYEATHGRVAVQISSTTLAGAGSLPDYHYTLRLLSQDGNILTQRDGVLGGSALAESAQLPGAIVPQPIALPMPAGLAPGEYLVALGVYTFNDGQPVALAVGPAASPQQLVVIGVVRP